MEARSGLFIRIFLVEVLVYKFIVLRNPIRRVLSNDIRMLKTMQMFLFWFGFPGIWKLMEECSQT